MQVVYQLSGVVDMWRPSFGLKKFAKSGLKAGSLDLSCFDWLFDTSKIQEKKLYASQMVEWILVENPEKIEDFVTSYLKSCKTMGISLPIAIMPSCAEPQIHLRHYEFFLDSCIKICSKFGIDSIVVPPLPSSWKDNEAFYSGLNKRAQSTKIQILLMNISRNYNGHYNRAICCDAIEAAQWIDRLNQEQEYEGECFGFFMDMRCCNVCGQNMYEFAVALGKRMKGVRVSDNEGQTLSSLIPFSSVLQGQSKVDWLSFFRGMRKIEFDGILLVDASDSVAVLSTMLKTDFLQYEKKIGEYLEFQIELETVIKKYPKRVLFGAGNMCRNYMKCYGKEYPPLFTCDNNSNLWETEFEGLVIKNPEELKNLPDDCAIFICNLYYEEIQTQIEAMGLKNPIEWFNDEYLPIRCTDWFDARDRKLK